MPKRKTKKQSTEAPEQTANPPQAGSDEASNESAESSVSPDTVWVRGKDVMRGDKVDSDHPTRHAALRAAHVLQHPGNLEKKTAKRKAERAALKKEGK